MAFSWSAPTDPGPTQGWTQGPQDRGTFAILWTCLQTVVLVGWVCTNTNAPSVGASWFERIRDKFHLFGLTMLGPEWVFLLASAQHESAKASVRQFKTLSHKTQIPWTLAHAFYADMGGVHIQCPDEEIAFPVDARQLFYLVENDFIDFPTITQADLDAQSKTDNLARFVTLLQTVYFLLTLVARAVQRLETTTLELTVLGFVVCNIAITACWWHKPSDVVTHRILVLKRSIREILWSAGRTCQDDYAFTPLDFVNAPEYNATYNFWRYFANLLKKLRMVLPSASHQRPIVKISTINFPEANQRTEILATGLAIFYSLSFFLSWRFFFPSQAERLLWHAITILQLLLVTGGGTLMIVWMGPSLRTSRRAPHELVEGARCNPNRLPCSVGNNDRFLVARLGRAWDRPCNNTANVPPALSLPLKFLACVTPGCALYCICRAALLVEDIVSLRSQPAGVYKDVDWSKYLSFL